MSVPKQRKTRGRSNNRRMHIHLENPSTGKCRKCGHFVLPHTVCQNCGFYKGVEVINVLEKLTKKEKKQREKEMKLKEAEDKSGKSKEKPLSFEDLSKK